MGRTGKRYGNHLMSVLIPAWLLLVSACSVKDDRSACPCILELDFMAPDSVETGSVGLLLTSRDGYMMYDEVDVEKSGGRYSVPVPRTELHVRSWTGDEGLASEYGLLIPLGQDCPHVYMHDSDVSAEGETLHESVVLRKSHCVMTLMTAGEGRIASDVMVKGNVAGYDAFGQPLSGDFEYLLDSGGPGDAHVAVLPRQTDDSLMLEIDDGNGNGKAFALGHYIVSSGYDWTAPDLEDVTVVLDYALTEVRISVSGWEGVYKYDMEI